MVRRGLAKSMREEIDYFGRNCLVARRLLERGTRFVQIWSGTTTASRDATGIRTRILNVTIGHWRAGMATGAAALIQDLKQLRLAGGYDHPLDHRVRPHALQSRFAGTRSQSVRLHELARWRRHQRVRDPYGPSDEWSYKPAEPDKASYCYDIHATILHLLGIDHQAHVP